MIRLSASLPTILLAAMLALPASASAQEQPFGISGSGGERVDGIAAVVGDSIVLMSQVMEEIGRIELSGGQVPEDPAQLRALQRQVTEGLVDQLLVLQAAERDTTVTVADDRIQTSANEAWEEQVQRFGGEAALRTALEENGLTLDQYRREIRNQIRRSLLLQTYFQTQRAQIQTTPVDEAEVREYYERERGQLGERPATLTVRQLFFQPEPSDSAKTAARERAEEVLQMIQEGEDFNELARRLSDDEGSRQQGGDLGWYRRGEGLVQEFEDAAFRLLERQISQVVETQYGAHIIRVERVRGAERRIHHILIAAETTPEDDARARARASEIANEIRDGASFAEFASESTEFGIPDTLTIARDQLGELPTPYADALEEASPGEVVGPVEFSLEEGVTVYVVGRVEDVRQAGAFTFEDVRDQIRANLRERKFEEELIEGLRARTYVDIRL